MPYLVCQNEECGHRFYERSELAAMSGCPECGEEVELEDSSWEPKGGAPAEPARDRAARFAEIVAAAEQLLARYGVVEPPVDVERIAFAEGLRVERRNIGDADGFLEDGVVIVNGDHARTRQRFTIAHEIGHLALHADTTDEHSEREADQFASALLIPRTMLRTAFASTPDPGVLRQRFNVSREALWIALKDAGLDRDLGV